MSCHGEVPVEILSHKTKALFHPAINSQCEGLTTEGKASGLWSPGHSQSGQALKKKENNEITAIGAIFMI